MSPEEYNRQITATVAPGIQAANTAFSAVRHQSLTTSQWLELLKLLFPVIAPLAWAASKIARDFYDSQRESAVPGVPVQPVDLIPLSFDRFVRDMEPVRKTVEQPDKDIGQAVLRVARTIENNARFTMMKAVESPDEALDEFTEDPRPIDEHDDEEDYDPIFYDPDDEFIIEQAPEREVRRATTQVAHPTRLVKGWARVPTGRETCGFCWMLASRGPVYKTAGGAGGRLGDSMMMQLHASDEVSSENMNQWHAGCDCKVVPVFKQDSWPGKEKYAAAWQLWQDVVWKGKYYGKDAINAYRRAVESGELDELLLKAA